MNNWKTCPICKGEFLRLSYHPVSNLCHHCYRRPSKYKIMGAVEFLVEKMGVNIHMHFGYSAPGDIGIIYSIRDNGEIFVASNGFIYRCNKYEIKKTNVKLEIGPEIRIGDPAIVHISRLLDKYYLSSKVTQ